MTARSSSARFRASNRRVGPTFIEAIERMKSGEVLRLEYLKGRPVWSIGNEIISAEVVSLLTSCREIQADGGSLLPNTPAQVWRLRKRDA
jgi:hypothetical protein